MRRLERLFEWWLCLPLWARLVTWPAAVLVFYTSFIGFFLFLLVMAAVDGPEY